ncbi:hypothetical protein BWK60_07755 [Flavobacterium covae]|uniref:hypothetical protein n=1 Tax=Flavobacterium covae TaxID=2906076 RepID=UPI000B4CB7F2|nr:hypothetical protein [Flavobacterium covae]OWP86667.1 hypothetical protein BWK60_07755 [Flavobacterium covae]
MKFIDVVENGTNVLKSIAVDKIKSLESLTYNNGTEVTVILFTDNTEIHVNDSVNSIKTQLS